MLISTIVRSLVATAAALVTSSSSRSRPAALFLFRSPVFVAGGPTASAPRPGVSKVTRWGEETTSAGASGGRRSRGKRGLVGDGDRRPVETIGGGPGDAGEEEEDGRRPVDTIEAGGGPAEEEFGEPSKCRTTFDAGSGAFGIFFSVTALSTMRITSLDFHTDRKYPVDVLVYARRGEYVGYELLGPAEGTNPVGGGGVGGRWSLISSATVQGAGHGSPTAIPPLEFRPVTVERDETVSFYLTLTTEDLRYTATNDDVGSVYVRTPWMEVRVGTGSSGYPTEMSSDYRPFDIGSDGLFEGRVFNGIIHYESSNADGSNGPTDLGLYRHHGSLETTFEGGTSGPGVMFDVLAHRTMVVTGIDVHVADGERARLEVWTRGGTYAGSESVRSEWMRIAGEVVSGRGIGNPTPVAETFYPVPIEAGRTQSFYVTVPSVEDVIIYTPRVDLPSGTEYARNDDLLVHVGAAVERPFGESFGSRVFNGIVHYSTQRTQLVTQQLIQVSGVAARRLLDALEENRQEEGAAHHVGSGCGGVGRVLQIAGDSVTFFEDVTRGFVQSSGSDSGIEVSSVLVSQDIDPTDVTFASGGGGGGDDDFGGDGEPVLDMYTTITGEYNPPPAVDFGGLVGDAFEDKGDAFVREIKRDPVFEEATGVRATEVSFPLPRNPAEEAATRGNAEIAASQRRASRLLDVTYGTCAAVICVVLLGVAGIILLKRRRQRTRGLRDDFDEDEESSSWSQKDALSHEDERSSRDDVGGMPGGLPPAQ